MKLKTSFFNKTIFNKNIKRLSPLWITLSILGSLVPVIWFLSMEEFYDKFYKDSVASLYSELGGSIIPVVTFIYAVLVAMGIWNYMYTASSAGFFHSVPMTRLGLFFTNCMSGLAVMLIPYIPAGIVSTVVTASLKAYNGKATLLLIAEIVLLNVFFFSFATLTAHITANITALPLLYLFFNFAEVLVEFMVTIITNGFLYGVDTNYEGKAEFLSPIVYICDAYVMNDYFGSIKVIALYALAGLALFVATFFIYRARKVERATEVVTFTWLKNVVHIALTLITAFLGGLLLNYAFNGFASETYKATQLSFCMIIAGAIAYYLGKIIVERNTKVFSKKSLIGLGACSLFYILVCVGASADILNVEGYVPKASDVKTATLSFSADDIVLEGDTDFELIGELTDIHKLYIDSELKDMEAYDQLRSNVAYTEFVADSDSDYYDEYIYINYELKSGRKISRTYLMVVHGSEDEYSDFDNALKDFLSNKDLVKKLLHEDDEYKPDSSSINCNYGNYNNNTDLEPEDTKLLLEAIKKDIDEGTWTPLLYDYATTRNQAGEIYIDINFVVKENTRLTPYDYIDVEVNKNMTNTINALKALNVIREEDVNRVFAETK